MFCVLCIFALLFFNVNFSISLSSTTKLLSKVTAISRFSWTWQHRAYCYRSGKGDCTARPQLSRACVPSAHLVSFAFTSSQVRRGPWTRRWGTWRGGAVWHPWSPRCPQGLRQPSRMTRSSLRSSSNRRRWLNTASSCECGCCSGWVSWEPGIDSWKMKCLLQMTGTGAYG